MKSFSEELSEIIKAYNCDENRKKTQSMLSTLSNKPVVLYGAGEIGYSVYKYLEEHGVKASCICDKYKVGIFDKIGIPIVNPLKLLTEYVDSNIVICSVNYFDEIQSELKKLGVSPNRIFNRQGLNLHGMTLEAIEPYIEGYERAFYLFSDDKSREILLNRIKCFLLSVPMPFLSPSLQYFDPDIISLNQNEIFADGGMFTGDTAEHFINAVNNEYAHYYGFEPDLKNLAIAKENLKEKHCVHIIEKGLWSSEMKLCFSGNFESSSKLDITGDYMIEVISLDSYFKEKTPPTFIKMDIEGAELEALKGSRNIIIENKPKLAICAYHKLEDIYSLLDLIKTYRSDYKFYLRHYSESIYETVLYAV